MDLEKQNFIKEFIQYQGPFLFGVAPISKEIRKEFLQLPEEVIEDMDRAISLAYPLLNPIIEGIYQWPTILYKHHYKITNGLLNDVSLRLAVLIQEKGYKALQIPASVYVDWESQRAHLSHKVIAYLAGLGWIGRNNLLVTPKYGARVRLVTILTDMPLRINEKINRDCDSCYACLSTCPVQAIGETASDYNLKRCTDKLKDFSKEHGVRICGICQKACPGPIKMQNSK